MKTLRLILGDQLNEQHSWFNEVDPNIIYCMFEMQQETNYVVHHIQKVVGFFGAMRTFAASLKAKGHQVVYLNINDTNNTQELPSNLTQLITAHNIATFEYLAPDEYRLDKQLNEFCKTCALETNCVDTEHFYTTRTELADFFKGKKQFLMESFYRYMRKKHHLLMEGTQPEGGAWNYDKNNRNKWKENTLIPPVKTFTNNLDEILEDLQKAAIKTLGKIDPKNFSYPFSRDQALEQLNYFCEELLPYFGVYQDAMHTREVNLYHSRISFALNSKLISPKEVIETAIHQYRNNQRAIDIAQIEGFVRQILGWREYMRGMYWMSMPDYKKVNALENSNPLPPFYWTGETQMNCVKHSVQNSLDHAYAHHIQRLMITGNYALLTNTDPDEVDRWYLGIYADAIEWVQLTNTRGMSQFADGGKIATKPYVSSGSYIQKMSNYCESCKYNVKEKTSANACPFNSLYWNFLDEKRSYLSGNRRMSMMYALLNKMDPEQLFAIKERAAHIIENPNAY